MKDNLLDLSIADLKAIIDFADDAIKSSENFASELFSLNEYSHAKDSEEDSMVWAEIKKETTDELFKRLKTLFKSLEDYE